MTPSGCLYDTILFCGAAGRACLYRQSAGNFQLPIRSHPLPGHHLVRKFEEVVLGPAMVCQLSLIQVLD